MDKILVVGGGSWGTSFAHYLTSIKKEIKIWIREKEILESIRIKHENNIFLPGILLSSSLKAVSELEEEVSNSDIIILAVPSKFLASIFLRLKRMLTGKVIINLSKGFESSTMKTISQMATHIVGGEVMSNWITISGPSFARELAQKHPTAVVAASKNSTLCRTIQGTLSSDVLRIYQTNDLIGVEVAGSLKNIMAIAAGILNGLGYGYNSTASLVTRANMEITRFGLHQGALRETFWGLAGIGDLMLTCFGVLSRNFQLGRRIALGETLEEIEHSSPMVAEGVETTKAVYLLADKLAIDMPITKEVYNILFEEKDIKMALRQLMKRRLKTEWNIN